MAPRASSPGVPPQVFATLMIVGLIAASALFVISQTPGGSPEDGPTAESDQGAPPGPAANAGDETSPFADLDLSRWQDAVRQSAATGSNAPAGSSGGPVPAALRDHADWQRALELVDEGQGLLNESYDAHEAGRAQERRDKAGAARQRYEEALRLTEPWIEPLRQELGPSNRELSNFMKRREKWLEVAAALRRQRV